MGSVFPLPFVLVLGTRKPNARHAHDEEYRWTILPLAEIPNRSAVFCRNPDGTMIERFVRSHFARRPVYDGIDAIFQLLPSYAFAWLPGGPLTAGWYTVQIEHFPDRRFPE